MQLTLPVEIQKQLGEWLSNVNGSAPVSNISHKIWEKRILW